MHFNQALAAIVLGFMAGGVIATPARSTKIKVSANGTCGQHGRTIITCQDSGFGNCCSVSGRCGSGPRFCGSGCQSAFGTCKQTKSRRPKKGSSTSSADAPADTPTDTPTADPVVVITDTPTTPTADPATDPATDTATSTSDSSVPTSTDPLSANGGAASPTTDPTVTDPAINAGVSASAGAGAEASITDPSQQTPPPSPTDSPTYPPPTDFSSAPPPSGTPSLANRNGPGLHDGAHGGGRRNSTRGGGSNDHRGEPQRNSTMPHPPRNGTVPGSHHGDARLNGTNAHDVRQNATNAHDARRNATNAHDSRRNGTNANDARAVRAPRNNTSNWTRRMCFPGAPQAITNPSFESGSTNWTLSGGAAVKAYDANNTWYFAKDDGKAFLYLESSSTFPSSAALQSVVKSSPGSITVSYDWAFSVTTTSARGPPQSLCSLTTSFGGNVIASWTRPASQGGVGREVVTFSSGVDAGDLRISFACADASSNDQVVAALALDNVKFRTCELGQATPGSY